MVLCMQVDELKHTNRRKPLFEGHEHEKKEQYLIGESIHNRYDLQWPETHWDIKSTELRDLQHQVSC